MKKYLTLALAAVLMVAILAVNATAATVTNLIPNDASKWKSNAGGENDAAITFEGTKAVITAPGGWPSMQYDPSKAIEVDPKTAYLNLKFKLISGGTSIRLVSGSTDAGEQIMVHQFINGVTFDNAGDLATAATYQLSIAFKDLKCFAGTDADKYTGKKDLVLNSNGKYVFNSIVIFAVGGAKLEIEKFEISNTADVVSTPAESSAVSTESVVSAESVASESSTVTNDSSVVAVSEAASTISAASSADSSTDSGNENNNMWIWIVIGGVVVVGGGVAAFFVLRKKK